MATIGNLPSFSGSESYGISTPPYQVAEFVGAWPGGTISQVSVYVGGWQAACNMQLCIWDSGGALLWSSGVISVPQASGTGSGQQAWVNWTGTLNLAAQAGGIFIGVWRDPAARFVYSRDGSSSYTKGNNSSAGSLNSTGTSTGTLGAYANYTPAPVITGVSPNPANSGQAITINGTNFGGATGSVSVGGVAATVTFWSDTSITATLATSYTTSGTQSVVATTAAGFASAGFTITVNVGGLKRVDSGTTFTRHPIRQCTNASPVTFVWRPLRQCTALGPVTFVRRA